MCLLTFVPEGIQPNMDALVRGSFTNDDGHGYAIVHEDQLIIGHGMDANSMIDEFCAVRSQYRDGPALFHSRFSTHGEVTTDNIHPFFVGRDRRTVLAHNGVLPAVVQPRNGDARSDTRIAAEDYIPSMGALHRPKTRARVEQWMTDYNKIVILSVNPRYRERSYILNEDAGTWDNGIWYSNEGYRPYQARYGKDWGTGWGTAAKEPLPDECWECNSTVDYDDGNCRYCGVCFDCGEGEYRCQCYTPMALARGKADREREEYRQWWDGLDLEEEMRRHEGLVG